MKRDAEIDLFPPGTLVQTPTGRVGVVQKVRGAKSRRDHFMRLCVWFGPRPRDAVVLQPSLLKPFAFIPE